MAASVKDLRTKPDLDQILKEGAPAVLHFWASWCLASAQMDVVFAQLCSDSPHARFFRVEAEEAPEISGAFDVSAVPFFVLIKDGAVVDKLEGANPSELANKVAKLASAPLKTSPPVSLGMAAGPAIEENGLGLARGSSNGPVSKKVERSSENGDNVKSKLQDIINSKSIMLFMKGTPGEPKCGFSRKVVDIFKELGVEIGSFDILTDEAVRQGMKSFSNWPTFPQLYIAGEFIGGCDIVTEMQKSGELKEVLAEKGLLPTPRESIESKLKKLIHSSRTMLFMKGTPDAPLCGFSSKVVNALNEDGANFGSFDILSDDEVRRELKTYSNWPTYPQLYHNGELIGGCDIILEMKESGELKAALS